jgi:hypothetical protein
MGVAEEHFAGFDPRTTPPIPTGCPLNNGPAYVVWFEAYAFTAWRAGVFRNTGIGYLWAYKAFDICGNMLRSTTGVDFPTFGLGGNYTANPFENTISFKNWLAFARKKAAPFNLPAPGTLQFTNWFHERAGWRA